MKRAPLANSDILQWDNAEQKFKPAQLPVGVVPPVDSVNGETGVVSLGIQDMNDFGYDREVGVYSGNTDKASGSVDTPGEWDMGSSPGFSYLSWHNDQSAAMDTLVAGTAVTFSSPGLPDHSTTVATNPTANDANSRYVQLDDEWPQEYIDAPSGTPLVVTAAELPSTPIQPLWVDRSSSGARSTRSSHPSQSLESWAELSALDCDLAGNLGQHCPGYGRSERPHHC